MRIYFFGFLSKEKHNRPQYNMYDNNYYNVGILNLLGSRNEKRVIYDYYYYFNALVYGALAWEIWGLQNTKKLIIRFFNLVYAL